MSTTPITPDNAHLVTTIERGWEPAGYTEELKFARLPWDDCAEPCTPSTLWEDELEWATQQNQMSEMSETDNDRSGREKWLAELDAELEDSPESAPVGTADCTCSRCGRREATPCQQHLSLYSTPKPNDPRLCQECIRELAESEMEAICSL